MKITTILKKVVPYTGDNNSTATSGQLPTNGLDRFTVPQPMIEQEVTPPQYMWDRISKALDEQERTSEINTTEVSEANLPMKEKKNLFANLAFLV